MTNEFDIILHPMVVKWFRDFMKNEPLGFCFITDGNSNYFKSIWGNPSGTNKSTTYWKRDYLGITIYVHSNQINNETIYKVQYLGDKESFIQDKKIGTYITGFLSKMTKELLT